MQTERRKAKRGRGVAHGENGNAREDGLEDLALKTRIAWWQLDLNATDVNAADVNATGKGGIDFAKGAVTEGVTKGDGCKRDAW
jgi:hypothetical protein